jgi:hypothetical protein
VLSTLPIDYIVLLVKEGYSSLYLHLRILRLLKLYRLLEVFELWRKRSSMNVLIIRIVFFVLGFLAVVYWFNLMLIYVSR